MLWKNLQKKVVPSVFFDYFLRVVNNSTSSDRLRIFASDHVAAILSLSRSPAQTYSFCWPHILLQSYVYAHINIFHSFSPSKISRAYTHFIFLSPFFSSLRAFFLFSNNFHYHRVSDLLLIKNHEHQSEF